MYKVLNWNTGLTEKEDYGFEILQYVKNFLTEEKTIAVRQQIPYKTKSSEGQWVLSDFYIRFLDLFPQEKYNVTHNTKYNDGYILMLTVIVTQIDTLSVSNNVYPNEVPTNREAAIYNEFTLLGLHAKNGKDNLSYIKSINGNADIIVGDFNAGDYPEYIHWKFFKTILPTHVCVCNVPTKRIESKCGELIRETCIDHIYIRRTMVTRCINVIVHREIEWSDHYPITFCIR